MNLTHIPVLLKEVIDNLNLKQGDIFLDGTVGLGGHSGYICRKYGRDLKIIGLDLDKNSLHVAEEHLRELNCDAILHQANFRNLDQVLRKLEIEKVDAILFDLGLSSYLLEESGRGFSFQRDEPLLMTFKSDVSEYDLTAKIIVNEWSEEEIVKILKEYGEERFAKRIAEKIIEIRRQKSLETTFDLIAVIKEAVPHFYQKRKIHFATKTFQALRIAANDELEALREALDSGFENLCSQGRMAVISFQSLEDRIVKHFNKEKEREELARIITKKPITPTEEEIKENPKSRSAKLRILEKNLS